MKALVRVKNLLFSPSREWDAIAQEDVRPSRLALGYVAPLVAIPTVATVVGLSVLGVDAGGALFRAPVLGVALSAALFFALSILAVFVFAGVIDWLAQRFGAQKSYRQAFKVSAYSITAAMLAGALTVAPALGVFALLGATYSLYLLFVGAPKVMNVSGKPGVNFAIVATLAAIAVALVVGVATMATSASTGALPPTLAVLERINPTPRGSAVDVGSAPLPPAAGDLVPGAPGVVTGGDLRGATPLKIGTLDRVAVSVERRGLPGAQTVEVEAEYRRGQRYIVLQLLFSPTIASSIGFGGPATSEYDRETADGYSRRRRAGDAIVVEDWNNASKSGSYGRLIEDRFYVKATGGGGTTPQDLRAAVELFGRETLKQMEENR